MEMMFLAPRLQGKVFLLGLSLDTEAFGVSSAPPMKPPAGEPPPLALVQRERETGKEKRAIEGRLPSNLSCSSSLLQVPDM